MTTETKTRTSTAAFKAIVRDLIDGLNDFKLSAITETALQAAGIFLDRKSDIEASLIYLGAYQSVREVTSESRNIKVVKDRGFAPEGAVQSKQGLGVFRTWLEHAGDRTLTLPVMTREDLQMAAEEREAQADIEARRAAFLRALAAGLNAEQTVADRYTEDEIRAIYQQTVEKD